MSYELTLEQKKAILNRFQYVLRELPPSVDEMRQRAALEDKNDKFPSGAAKPWRIFRRVIKDHPDIISFPEEMECRAVVVCRPSVKTKIHLVVEHTKKVDHPSHESSELDPGFGFAVSNVLEEVAQSAGLKKTWIAKEPGDYTSLVEDANRILVFIADDRDNVLQQLNLMLNEIETRIKAQSSVTEVESAYDKSPHRR